MSKRDRVALKSRYLNSKQFLSIFSVPDSDFIGSCSGEDVRIVERESHVIDLFIMAGVSELRSQVGGVDPVNVGLRAAAEEMGVVSSEGN